MTTLSINALANAGEPLPDSAVLRWLLACRQIEEHPFTHAQPGGWGWTDKSGAVPDADDTPGALLALAAYWQQSDELSQDLRAEVAEAAVMGVRWLLDLQNRDGGWPTFCKGWGRLPFDRSGVDLTAHVLRALRAWLRIAESESHNSLRLQLQPIVDARRAILRAVRRGFHFLRSRQHPDGAWHPLWFGNEFVVGESNPVYGTSKCLLAYRDWGELSSLEVEKGIRWLTTHQCRNGGWGACREDMIRGPSAADEAQREVATVEETALALNALATIGDPSRDAVVRSIERGTEWLCAAVESGDYRRASPIGFYFAKLWYYEKMYPLVFAFEALAALRKLARRARREP